MLLREKRDAAGQPAIGDDAVAGNSGPRRRIERD
jgi:hypothetical protein